MKKSSRKKQRKEDGHNEIQRNTRIQYEKQTSINESRKNERQNEITHT